MPEGRLVAIHQPNFLPWLGFFDKVRRADVFIVMDNVQFSKTGGTWTNRVQWLVAGAPSWATMPIVRAYSGTRKIAEMEIDNSSPWRDKLRKTLDLNYRRASHFNDVFPLFSGLLKNPTDKVVDFNLGAIKSVLGALNLNDSKLVLGSTLPVAGHSTELLIAMVRAVGGTAYLVGGGAAGYQDDWMFEAAGLAIVAQNFQHPRYSQVGSREFVPGLSIVDVLMNIGCEATRSWLR
jgi:hypothetical protein